jgi:hypothetical protein
MAPHRQTTSHIFQFTYPIESIVVTVYLAARDDVCTSLHIAKEAITAGVITATSRKIKAKE